MTEVFALLDPLNYDETLTTINNILGIINKFSSTHDAIEMNVDQTHLAYNPKLAKIEKDIIKNLAIETATGAILENYSDDLYLYLMARFPVPVTKRGEDLLKKVSKLEF